VGQHVHPGLLDGEPVHRDRVPADDHERLLGAMLRDCRGGRRPLGRPDFDTARDIDVVASSHRLELRCRRRVPDDEPLIPQLCCGQCVSSEGCSARAVPVSVDGFVHARRRYGDDEKLSRA
jgi:hypothetical protein